jgi:hypothetical protein
VYVTGALRWTAKGRSLPGRFPVSEPGGPRASHLPWVSPASSAASGPELRESAPGLGSLAKTEAPPVRVPARSFGIGRRHQGDLGGRAASFLTALRDDRRGQMMPPRPLGGCGAQADWALRPGGAFLEIAGARAPGWRSRASRPAGWAAWVNG